MIKITVMFSWSWSTKNDFIFDTINSNGPEDFTLSDINNIEIAPMPVLKKCRFIEINWNFKRYGF